MEMLSSFMRILSLILHMLKCTRLGLSNPSAFLQTIRDLFLSLKMILKLELLICLIQKQISLTLHTMKEKRNSFIVHLIDPKILWWEEAQTKFLLSSCIDLILGKIKWKRLRYSQWNKDKKCWAELTRLKGQNFMLLQMMTCWLQSIPTILLHQ